MSNEHDPLAEVSGDGTLLRPRYSRGLLLEDDDLTAAVSYTRDFVRLMFRSMFGCGVICGLDVDAEYICNGSKLSIAVKPGIGLDCLGNPIEVCNPQPLIYDPKCLPFRSPLWVLACYVEKCARPRDVSCSQDEDSQVVQTRVHSRYQLKVVDTRPKCACSCEKAEPAAANPDHQCCDNAGTTTIPTTPTTNEPEDECACYKKHNAGICDCTCGCTCIVIAKITLDPPGQNAGITVDDTKVRRFIRPALLGYEECRKLHPLPAPAPQPAPPPPAATTTPPAPPATPPADGQIN